MTTTGSVICPYCGYESPLGTIHLVNCSTLDDTPIAIDPVSRMLKRAVDVLTDFNPCPVCSDAYAELETERDEWETAYTIVAAREVRIHVELATEKERTIFWRHQEKIKNELCARTLDERDRYARALERIAAHARGGQWSESAQIAREALGK